MQTILRLRYVERGNYDQGFEKVLQMLVRTEVGKVGTTGFHFRDEWVDVEIEPET
jgi:hypothetical protein